MLLYSRPVLSLLTSKGGRIHLGVIAFTPSCHLARSSSSTRFYHSPSPLAFSMFSFLILFILQNLVEHHHLLSSTYVNKPHSVCLCQLIQHLNQSQQYPPILQLFSYPSASPHTLLSIFFFFFFKFKKNFF